jgi:hypothetical protein
MINMLCQSKFQRCAQDVLFLFSGRLNFTSEDKLAERHFENNIEI